MQTFLGIDWGGTYIKAGVVDSRGEIIHRQFFVSYEVRKKKAFVKKLKDLLDSFRKFEISAVGIGVPGIVNIEKGFIYYLPNISGWEKYPLKTVLEEQLGLPIYIDNDANLFALAEARLGAGKGFARGIFLTLGTGLGGAVISDGKILQGATSAGELGHVPVNINGIKCGCGGRGCIETLVGNKYLMARYRELKQDKEIAVKEVKDIFRKALDGEKEALVVWEEFSRGMGVFLSGMINVFNPQVIVFGGGVSGAFSLFKPLIWKEIIKQAMWPQVKGLKLKKAKLNDAGIIGAALLAKEKK